MKTIVLKKYYPHLKENTALEVSDEIAAVLSVGGRLCDSYKRRKQDHSECSMDTDPGFEADVTHPPSSQEQILEAKEDRASLHAAIAQLPAVQARRVHAHYILGISKREIAQAEGVGISRVSGSIRRGLLNLKNILKNSL